MIICNISLAFRRIKPWKRNLLHYLNRIFNRPYVQILYGQSLNVPYFLFVFSGTICTPKHLNHDWVLICIPRGSSDSVLYLGLLPFWLLSTVWCPEETTKFRWNGEEAPMLLATVRKNQSKSLWWWLNRGPHIYSTEDRKRDPFSGLL